MKASGIGGQAVMEGVMMKNGDKYAVAVRKPNKEVVVDVQDSVSLTTKYKFFAAPIIRGVVTFIESLATGVKTLTYSASFFEEDENEKKPETPEEEAKKKKKDDFAMAGTVCLSVILAVGIFMLLPYFLSRFLAKVITSEALLALCEGIIRIALFVGYVAAISCMEDIKRVFMYHGAEHKSINCIENGLPLTVENVRKQSREHKRCGTSFLLFVMIISVFLFMFIRVDNAWLRILYRLVLIPVIAGISYEFIRLAGRSENKVIAFFSKPGLALQTLTTREPDDSMIEVAIASVEAVFNWEKFLADYRKPSGDLSCYRIGCKPAAKEADDIGAEADKQNGKQNEKHNGNKSGNKPGNASKPATSSGSGSHGKKKKGKKGNGAAERKAAIDREMKAQLEAELAAERKAEEEAKAAEAAKAEEEAKAAEAAKAEEETKAAEAAKAAETAKAEEEAKAAEAARTSDNKEESATEEKKSELHRDYIGVDLHAPIEPDGEDDDEVLRKLDRYFTNNHSENGENK